jgi:WD40 repeat protein
MAKIFISHSSTNNASALAVAEWLREYGWADCFLDITPADGLAPGERWQEALKRAADSCEAVLFLISPAWRDSRWCLAEFLLAKQLGKLIFGALIEPTPLDTLPNEMTTEWQLCDLVSGSERRVFHVGVDPIVSDTDVSFAEAGLRRLRIGLQKSGLNPATFVWPPAHDPERCPYRGLKALEAEDAAVFFGRDPAIVRALDFLRGVRDRKTEQMVVILGASGAGKSSFLRAGLWPRLARDDRNFLPLPVLRPAGAVLSGAHGLAASLESAFRARRQLRSRAECRAALDRSQGLEEVVSELVALEAARLEPDALPPTVLLLIDQGEELFTNEGRTESETFFTMLSRALATIAERPRVALVAIVAMRSDSYERLQSQPQLERVRRAPFDLGPFPRTEYKSVIEGPALRATESGRPLEIDPALTEQLLNDAEGADALPLLAFTLESLVLEHGGGGKLRVADYLALGGVSGVIQRAIETAFVEPGRDPAISVDPAERNARLRHAFIPWLARIDPDTEQRKRRVARWDEIPVEGQPLIQRMVSARLLVRDWRNVENGTEKADVVEVAHEALLRQWPALTTWLDADADALKAAESLQHAATEWLRQDRASAWLVHTGERLDLAEALGRRTDFHRLLTPHTLEYLSACRRNQERAAAEREAQFEKIAAEQARTARAQRFGRWLLACVALLLVGISTWVIAQAREVSRQTSRVLVTAAETALRESSYDRGLRLAVLAAAGDWLSPAVPEAGAQLIRNATNTRTIVARMTHDGPVTATTFSSDGRYLLTASADGTARMWDASTAKELTRMTHDAAVFSARLSPDGQRIVTASADETARVWNATTGQELARLEHDDWVSLATFSPDGSRILTASGDTTARIFDVKTGKELARLFHDNSLSSASFSPDGQRVLTSSIDKTALIWDSATGEEGAKLRHDGPVLWGAFSPDGRQVITASVDKTARVWEVATGQEVVRVRHDAAVFFAAFSPDGSRIVTASADRTARVWDAKSGKEQVRLVHDGTVSAAGFSPDGRRVVTASSDDTERVWSKGERFSPTSKSSDRTARVWDATTGREFARFAHDDAVSSAGFSPDGRQVVTASADTTARIWEIETTARELVRMAHDDRVHSAHFSADGQRIVTASADGSVRVWGSASGQQLGRLPHDADVLSASFGPDERSIVTAVAKAARVWNATTGKEIVRIAVSNGDSLESTRMSPDGRTVATASWRGIAGVWDATTGRELAHLSHDAVVSFVDFSLDGRLMVTASRDRTARIWDPTTGKERVRLPHDFMVFSASFSADGRRLVTSSRETVTRLSRDTLQAETRIWDTDTGKELLRVKHDHLISVATLSRDGRQLLTASDDKTVRLWDAETGKELSRLLHEDAVVSASYSPDGRRIVSASADGTARVWDVATGTEVARLVHDGAVSSAEFIPDGRRVLTASDDGTARVWDVTLTSLRDARLIEFVCAHSLARAGTKLTSLDVKAAPILFRREGEDICHPPSSFTRAWTRLAGLVRRTAQ